MKTQLLALTFASLSLLPAMASSNQDCIEVYRDGYLDLRESIIDYNEKRLDQVAFAGEVTAISTAVSGLRAACFFTESPDAKECVDSYKVIYKDLRDRVRVRAVLAGNQDKVTFSEGSTHRANEESGSAIGNFFRNLRSSGADATKLGRLAIVDAKCL